MKLLHLIGNEKFTASFIRFVRENFGQDDHMFVVYGDKSYFESGDGDNVHQLDKTMKSLAFLTKSLNRSDKIIIHGLFNQHTVGLLFCQPWLLRRCYWVIWGGDLYYHVMRTRSWRSDTYETVRKVVIKRFGGLVTHIRGDYELAKKWYGAQGTYHYCFMYPSNLYKDYHFDNGDVDDGVVCIQIGNSADPSNNHKEIFEKLSKYKDYKLQIICPLSYGNATYRDEIIELGKNIFGEKFIPLVDFMPFEEYLEILAKVDIAIFNHRRQQAMGNITTLLGLGKKVYIRSDITTWDFCKEHGLAVYDSCGNFEDLFAEMGQSLRMQNKASVREKFSEANLKRDWEHIFSQGDGCN